MGGYAELQQRARAVLDSRAYDFYAAGAGDETTLAANEAAWGGIRLRPRVLRDVSHVDTRQAVLGTPVSSPVLAAPTALHSLAHSDGELATAAGTTAAGSLLVVSFRASRRIEDVAAAAGPWWFQVYVLRDRGLTRELVQRAAGAGAGALVLTGDTPQLGIRRHAEDFAAPAESLWANFDRSVDPEGAIQARDVTDADVGWLREASGLPVLVKGVLRRDDARRCLEAGAAAVIVSNHGGRQLDGAVAAADALPEVVAEVGGSTEVYVDGGVRRGTDVLRALALGASGVLVGRPVLWGLATSGAGGVQEVLSGLTDDLARAMALAGTPDLSAVTPDLVWRPA